MSILINEAYANPSTPLWEANGGGSDGVRLIFDNIGSLSKAVNDGSSVKFFDINLPATFVGKSVRVTFSGNVGTIALTGGVTPYKILVGLLGNFTKPNGTSGQMFALSTITSTGTNQAGNISVSMVISPSDTTFGVYVFNRSGVNITAMTLTTSACAIELIDDSPTYTASIVTATL